MNVIIEDVNSPFLVVEAKKMTSIQPKRKPFAEKIARATAILEKTGLPKIETSKEAITCQELREVLLDLGFEEMSNDDKIEFIKTINPTSICFQKCAAESWLPTVLVADFSQLLIENSIIEANTTLFEIVKKQRLAVVV
jgi:hypothetical protein